MFDVIKKNGATLALFACASTGVVAVTHYLTEDSIKEQENAQLRKTLSAVVPNDLHDNQLYQNCVNVNNSLLGTTSDVPIYIATLDSQITAYAIESYAPDGYTSPIKLLIGLNSDLNVTGVRVLNHQETPGLGDLIDIRVSDWVLSFNGKTVTPDNGNEWKVKKDGGEFDQFTGATITPRAVVKAVKNTIELMQTPDFTQSIAKAPKCKG
ncbi:electron transport complex subunit RsxG [Vibrio sp.]|nr:electron transport complex subunit RsxG [Vibrio sp.]